MIPSVLATQLKVGLKDYLETTFPISTPAFQGVVQDLLDEPDAVFRDPYVSARLPFRVSSDDQDRFPFIRQPYPPFVHQQKAFDRLSGEDCRSTLVATGTGSGKTECFLYPILDYCFRHRGQPGIKALIIYPMNALAVDQAQRLARLIYANEDLRGNVTAGMYVGGHEAQSSKVMGPDSIITDRDMMRQSPPDILLTNYKMLDFLLIRPKDALLWQNNKPESLKFIVVDELHTFDGAQGTDLACLLRRLKARLYTPKGYICCIGTSATMGSKDNAGAILSYAGKIFGEHFEDNAVITEDRLTPAEFFEGYSNSCHRLPTKEHADEMRTMAISGEEENYLDFACRRWLDNPPTPDELKSDTGRQKLTEQLMSHAFVRDLLTELESGSAQYSFLIEKLGNRYPEIRDSDKDYVVAALDSLLALISHARTLSSNGQIRPFLQVHTQVWLRELRRMLAKVSKENISLALADDLNEEQKKQHLPVINCRDCGVTGWVSLLHENSAVTLLDLRAFYNAFFRQDKKITMLFPCAKDEPNPMLHTGVMLCPKCMHLNVGHDTSNCRSCGHVELIPNWMPQWDADKRTDSYICPFCESSGGMSLMGAQSATLISTGISQLYASHFNDDKKLLAFSDNVQDAAHRAGFFNARTWRFNLRNAVQKFVLSGGDGLTLGEFASSFVQYWQNQMMREELVAAFIPPTLTWRKTYENMLEKDVLDNSSLSDRLLDDIRRRMEYEVFLEYGMHSRIGRSLEKSGSSVLALDRSTLANANDRIFIRVTNEIGELHHIEKEMIEKITAGLLQKLKINGGFYRNIYEPFIERSGVTYLLSNDHVPWLPGSSGGRNIPRFIAKAPVQKRSGRQPFDLLTGKSWYERWVRKGLDLPLLRQEVPYEVNNIIIQELLNAGILFENVTERGIPVWSIAPNTFRVSSNVNQVSCQRCGTMISVSQSDSDLWDGSRCLRDNCPGYLKVSPDKGLDFYGKLYSHGDLVRINAHEHTGLLDRDEREKIEEQFKRTKEQHKPWNPNLLSCTPTLEMGIDIGDLSTIVLCSIPPAQAQYLQRIGRAGRHDGNALTIAVANARPHDLYFYADPLEMIAADISPPDVFLNASAVLERQFVAYCFDCWVKAGLSPKAIPERIGQSLSVLKNKPVDRFPFNFLLYIQSNLSWLNRSFIALFDNQLTDQSKEELRIFSHGDGITASPLDCRIIETFENTLKQREVLRKDVKRLQVKIRELENKPQDASFEKEIRSLRQEKGALQKVIASIDTKDVFNFFSDEGLLPNYAFPEAGIILKAVIYRKLSKEGEFDIADDKAKRYEHYIYEYSRPAVSAIREFAPSNSFYANGRKLNIDQIDLTSAQATPWRLCPSCSHAQMEVSGKDVAACPCCGSPAWADRGQVHSMLKVRMVYSNMEYATSRSGDEKDDRDTLFYCNEMLVDVDEANEIICAYKIDDDANPFGFEFVRKATIREINFGEMDTVGNKLTVAGREDVRKGFPICRHCGKVQREKTKEPQHTWACPVRNNSKITDFEDYLFLYREFISEAIRILIPATTFEVSDTRQESFIAGIMLGLKQYFGSVEHLRACISEVPLPNTDYRKKYLVLYDTVPGGTGYLKQLMISEEPMMEIFEKALEALNNCTCAKDSEKDGCYRCLFAYKQSQQIGLISRRVAIEILQTIIDSKKSIVQIQSINSIPVNSLFDSELERRFIEALERSRNESRPVDIHKQLVNMKEGYFLKIGDNTWSVEPQVNLDNNSGVAIPSKADFVLRPLRRDDKRKPVAVFTDGFTFHRDIVDSDTLKRMAIVRSGRFRVWSLTWKDIQHVFQNQGDYYSNTLAEECMPYGTIYSQTVNACHADSIRPSKLNSFELLLEYMANPQAEKLFRTHAYAFSLALLEPAKRNDAGAYHDWFASFTAIAEQACVQMPQVSKEDFFGTWNPTNINGNITIQSGATMEDVSAKKMDAVNVISVLEDQPDVRSHLYEEDWIGFLRFFNIMQFLHSILFVTKKGLENNLYATLTEPVVEGYRVDSVSNKWELAIEQLFDQRAKAYAAELAQQGIFAPSVVGYELENEDGEIVGQAELAWEDLKIAWLHGKQEEYASVFKEKDWKLLSSDIETAIKVFGIRSEHHG